MMMILNQTFVYCFGSQYLFVYTTSAPLSFYWIIEIKKLEAKSFSEWTFINKYRKCDKLSIFYIIYIYVRKGANGMSSVYCILFYWVSDCCIFGYLTIWTLSTRPFTFQACLVSISFFRKELSAKWCKWHIKRSRCVATCFDHFYWYRFFDSDFKDSGILGFGICLHFIN